MVALIIGIAVVMLLVTPFALASWLIGWLFIVLPVTGFVVYVAWNAAGLFGAVLFGAVALFLTGGLVGGMQQLKAEAREARRSS